jgi:hypothetical protein
MRVRDLGNEAVGPQETKEPADTSTSAPLVFWVGGIDAVKALPDVGVPEAVECMGAVGSRFDEGRSRRGPTGAELGTCGPRRYGPGRG